MNEQSQRQFVPIFEKDGNRFIAPLKGFVGTDETEAWKIGIGASLAECIMWGARFTGDTLELSDDIPYVEASLQGNRVAIISGPHFDAAPAPPVGE